MNTVSQNREDFSEVQTAFYLMDAAGMTLGQKLQVKSLLYKAAQNINFDVEKNNRFDCWSNKKVKHYSFSTEAEAAFAGALSDYMGDEYDSEAVVKVMSLVAQLVNKSDDYYFVKKKEKQGHGSEN